MMALPELQSRLERLGVKLSLRLVVDAPAGVITPAIKTALVDHKPALLARLVDHLRENLSDPAPSEGLPTEPSSAAIVVARPAEELSDANASAGNDAAFCSPARPTVTSHGPRDVRKGDRWLPWH